jgi:hypothetical protein
LHGGPQETFGAVAPDSHPDGLPSRHAHADFWLVAGLDNQDNKRMGIGFSETPHPLEIGRPGQAEFALQPRYPHD